MNQSSLIRNISIRRLPDNRSGITLVWLENSCSNLLYDDDRIRLKSFSDRCFIVYYSNISKSIRYLKKARSREYVITIIVSYPIETIQRLVHQLQPYRVIQAIYVVYSKTYMETDFSLRINNFHIFQNRDAMFSVLEKRINEVEQQNLNGGLFTTFCREEKSLKDVRQDMAKFVWTHIFKVLLTCIPRNFLEAKQQMSNECRAYYRNDRTQLNEINEFERKYHKNDAIYWFTKPGFLFYLVNKALRSQDMWALYKFRYFIMDLSEMLEELTNRQSFSSICLYRGTKMNLEEIKQLQVGCLISTNGFLSCSSDRNVAEIFAGVDVKSVDASKEDLDRSQQYVLFIIDVDRKISTDIIVADISNESYIPDENEFLFNFGSTFIINQVEFDVNKSLWLIHMSSSSDNTRINQGYEQYIRIRLQHISPIIMLGHILANIGGDLGQWMNYFHRLLKILPPDHDQRPNVYYCLGNIYRFIEKFDKALQCFRCAKLLVRRLLPERMFDYCRILAGIGTIYSYLGDSQRALKLLEAVYILQRKSFAENHSEIPFHLNLMAHAYIRAQQYHRALPILVEAETFFQGKMSVELQGYAQTLHLFGLLYRAQNFDDRALICFQETIRRRYSLLGKDHPHLASTYYQMSLLYADNAQYELAMEYIQKALNIQLVKLPHYHSESKFSKELLQKIQQYLRN